MQAARRTGKRAEKKSKNNPMQSKKTNAKRCGPVFAAPLFRVMKPAAVVAPTPPCR
jgi:hypothetical protein